MMAPRRRILFVDDEPMILAGFGRLLHSKRREWKLEFASSGPEALEVLARNSVDVVISDMRMPGMDGADLLNQVMNLYPQTIRIVLSGQSDTGTLLRVMGPTHQYLSKPCDPATLMATIARACALRDLLESERLRALVSQMKTLPSTPAIYSTLLAELNSAEPSIKKVGEIVSQDVGMIAKILQLVNSAYFGLRQHVASPAQAISLLGLKTIQALVLSYQVFAPFKKAQQAGLSPDRLWRHSLRVALYARAIIHAESEDPVVEDNAFLAGLVHDAGKLVLAHNFAEDYARMRKKTAHEKTEVCTGEQEAFGATHAEVGAYLLGLWGLPEPITRAIAFHHHPLKSESTELGSLLAVHVANVMDYCINPAGGETAPELENEYLRLSGYDGKVDALKQICMDTKERGGGR